MITGAVVFCGQVVGTSSRYVRISNRFSFRSFREFSHRGKKFLPEDCWALCSSIEPAVLSVRIRIYRSHAAYTYILTYLLHQLTYYRAYLAYLTPGALPTSLLQRFDKLTLEMRAGCTEGETDRQTRSGDIELGE